MIPKDGAFLVDKPEGVTSAGALERIKRAIRERTGLRPRDLPKIGHAGTLDPFATGLLVVLVGEATKLSDWLLGSDKSYSGVARFGEKTASGDRTNEITERTDRLPPSLEALRTRAAEFLGAPYEQLPPMFSAKKIEGRALYELAREGKEVERKTKTVRVLAFEVEAYDPPLARFQCHVSSGTYVRTLAEDWAAKAGSLAHLVSLRRERSGTLSLREAAPLAEIESSIRAREEGSALPGWVPLAALLSPFARIELSDAEARGIRNGRQDLLPALASRAAARAEDERGDALAGFGAAFAGGEPVAILKRVPPFGIERVFAPSG